MERTKLIPCQSKSNTTVQATKLVTRTSKVVATVTRSPDDLEIYSLRLSYVVSSEGQPKVLMKSEGELDLISVVGILELVKRDLMNMEGE